MRRRPQPLRGSETGPSRSPPPASPSLLVSSLLGAAPLSRGAAGVWIVLLALLVLSNVALGADTPTPTPGGAAPPAPAGEARGAAYIALEDKLIEALLRPGDRTQAGRLTDYAAVERFGRKSYLIGLGASVGAVALGVGAIRVAEDSGGRCEAGCILLATGAAAGLGVATVESYRTHWALHEGWERAGGRTAANPVLGRTALRLSLAAIPVTVIGYTTGYGDLVADGLHLGATALKWTTAVKVHRAAVKQGLWAPTSKAKRVTATPTFRVARADNGDRQPVLGLAGTF